MLHGPADHPCSSPCSDCGKETNHNCIDNAEWYMVKHEIWQEALVEKHAVYLCIGCLEIRLGRKLTYLDFSNVPLNFLPGYARSRRLKNRMKGLQKDTI
jgi:hypothetical protein